MLNRIRWSELTAERLMAGIRRRVQDLPDRLAWGLPLPGTRRNRDRLSRYAGIHRGERCVIVANGPSLLRTDLGRAQGTVTIGMNRIYLAFDRLPFVPTYYVCVNELVLEQFAGEIAGLPMPKFLNWNRRRLFGSTRPDTAFLRLALTLRETFGTDPRQPLSGGGTVTYAALQLAYYMGFREVILVGLDHTYSEKGTPNTIRERASREDTDHFDPRYFPAGLRWQLPDLRRSELAYALARRAFEADGRHVVDATPGGRCEVFEKVDLAVVLPG